MKFDPHHRNSLAVELRAELLAEHLDEARALGAAGKPRPTTAAIEAAVDQQVAAMFPVEDHLMEAGRALAPMALVVSVLGARDLRNADGLLGKSDPFVVVKWRGVDVGRTTTVPNDLNPTWAHESFVVPLGRAADVEACKMEGVVLEATIFDHDDISASDRLGGVVVTAADVLRVAEEGGEVDLVLQGVKGKKMGKSMLKLGFKMQQHA